jgi:hypothetical protein
MMHSLMIAFVIVALWHADLVGDPHAARSDRRRSTGRAAAADRRRDHRGRAVAVI